MSLVVDSHTHVFPPEVKRRRETFCQLDGYFSDLYEDPRSKIATVEDLLAEMDDAGVDVSVLCGFGWSSPELCAMHNDYMLDCIRRYPNRLTAMAAIQPTMAEWALTELGRCLSGGMKGVGELMPDGQGYRLDHFETTGFLFDAAAAAGFPVMTHSSEPVGHDYPGKQAVTPDILWNVIQAHPETTFILAHWGGGYPFYELMPEVRNASQNVYYDSAASTYLYSPDVFLQATQVAGSGKVLWGSDFPVLRQKRFVQRVRELPLETDARAQILGLNAVRVFGLGPRRRGDAADANSFRSWAF